MIRALNLSAAITIIVAMVATFGAAALQYAVMGVAGIVAAVAAIVWGLLAWVTRDESVDSYAAQYCPIENVEEDELPYVPVKDGRLPVWDTDIWGAFE